MRLARKRLSIWRLSAILNLKIFDFVKPSSSEWKFVSAYQIWSKSDNSRLRYGDKAIFKKAASAILNLRKLPFWSCYLHLHVVLHLRSKFRINRPIWCSDIVKKRFSISRPSAVLNSLWRHHIASETAFYVPNFVLNFHDVRLSIFWNILYFMFQHFGLKLPISSLILTIFFCENRQKYGN